MPKRPLCAVCLALILMLYAGIRLTGEAPSYYEVWNDTSVSLTGRVYQKETAAGDGKNAVVYLRLTDAGRGLEPAGLSREVNVICYLKPDQKLPEIGCEATLTGRLKCFEEASNPGQFDAKSYYHLRKLSFQLFQTEIQSKSETYSRLGEGLFQIREHCLRILSESLEPRYASVMQAMLLGEKKAMDEEIKELYQRNGIAHVLAISGLHISFLGMMLCKLIRKTGLPVAVQALTPMVCLIFYGVMTGFSVSSLRAVIMFGVQMAALFCGRTYDLVTAASLAALFLAAEQPYYLEYSGFLFSFGCVFAIGILVPGLTPRRSGSGSGPWEKTLSSFLFAGTVTAACLPLQLWFFGRIPVYSVLLNLLIVPLMSLLVPGGILLVAAAGLGLPVFPFAALVTGILRIYESACRFCEDLPFSGILLGRPDKWQIGVYLIFLGVAVLIRKKAGLKKRWAIVLCGIALLLWRGRSELQITFLDVGQGDCIYIRTEEGTNFLIDGGSSQVSSVGKYRILPYLKAQGAAELEGVFITHPDEDHCNGIRELLRQGKKEGIRIKRLYLPDIGGEFRGEAYHALEQAAGEAGVLVDYLGKKERLRQGDFSLLCLHPEEGWGSREANEYSMVLLLEYGGFRGLFAGDVEGEGERQLFDTLKELRIQDITLLKAAHHGSANSTSREMALLLSPAVTVISCGRNNSYGHPHEELLDRLSAVGSKIFITSSTGAVTLRTDGKTLSVEPFLKK